MNERKNRAVVVYAPTRDATDRIYTDCVVIFQGAMGPVRAARGQQECPHAARDTSCPQRHRNLPLKVTE